MPQIFSRRSKNFSVSLFRAKERLGNIKDQCEVSGKKKSLHFEMVKGGSVILF